MQIDELKLRSKMAEKGLSATDMARVMGVNVSTFYRKLNKNGQDFTIGEMHCMSEALLLSKAEAIEIFLPIFSQ